MSWLITYTLHDYNGRDPCKSIQPIKTITTESNPTEFQNNMELGNIKCAIRFAIELPLKTKRRMLSRFNRD